MRRDGRRSRLGLGRSGPAVDGSVERGGLTGRHTPRVGRRGPRARVPPACAGHLRRGRSGPRRRRQDVERARRHRRHAGARPRGIAAGRCRLRQGRRRVDRRAAARRASSGRAHRVPRCRGRPDAAAGSGPRRLGGAHEPVPHDRCGWRRTVPPPDRPHPGRRRGGGVRQGRITSRPRLSGRTGHRSDRANRRRPRRRVSRGADDARRPQCAPGHDPPRRVGRGP